MTGFSMTISTSQEAPTVREITMFGAMTIHHAAEIRTAMLDAFSEADEVRMGMSQVNEIDVVGLQLLCSAHRNSIAVNKLFKLVECRNASVKKTITDAGLKRHVGCVRDVDHTCIWMEVENNG
jgi:anti-anti-sigma factor